METQKKTWEKPQLIVLARGTPEESVLANCKTRTLIGGPSNDTAHNHCAEKKPGSCGACQAEGASGS